MVNLLFVSNVDNSVHNHTSKILLTSFVKIQDKRKPNSGISELFQD